MEVDNGLLYDIVSNTRILPQLSIPDATLGGHCAEFWSAEDKLSHGDVNQHYPLDCGCATRGGRAPAEVK